MIRIQKYLFLILGLIALAALTVCAVVEKNNLNDIYSSLFSRNTKIFSPPIPAAADFAGEKVPLDLYYVREAFVREIMASAFMHSSSILMFKRANRWFPVIEPILKKNGIPDDFKFLAVAESNLNNVVSPAKAEGYWQFLKSTGIQYGLEINDNVDERYNIEKATQAACSYFKASFKKFGNWTLVAASYNRGSDGLENAVENQKVSNYYDLYLNDETSRYVFRIIAIKEVYNNPVRYGFYLRQQDFYQQIPVKTISVDSFIPSLPAFAKKLAINYRILRELNPWIRNYSLPNKPGKTYIFNIPADGALLVRKQIIHDDNSETFFHDTLKINELH
ncbi:MAG: lytic transglycosylase domain-containing protein [Bacteroidetes bacterium]|nr:lytic transglycosylase domain-containing protein [Bacteroidota bacterium]